MAKPVRVRLAPSPTGDVHIGTIWLAQFNWLFAKQQRGSFIVRIEDTDQKRLVPGSVEKIYEALDWYGLTPDEGPLQGGPHAPYVQSERLALYQEHAETLVEKGSAYFCFCTPERLTELRTAQEAAKRPPRYDKRCLAIPLAEAKTRVTAGESHVIRLNIPTTGEISLNDLIRGRVTFRYDQVDDSVLVKSDGFPTYHLAVVVDDHAMNISHVIRGEEWLSSAPKHLLLFEQFGWTPPVFAHLPLILGQDKKKLSKRHGASSALSFRDQGYLPEAMQNFLVLMGWHPKGDHETLNRTEVLEQFDLTAVNSSGAIFDQAKLDWLNGWYIRQLTLPDLLVRVKPWWNIPAESTVSDAWLQSALTIVCDRLKTLAEIDEATLFLFPNVWSAELTSFDRSILIPKKGTSEVTNQRLQWARQWLSTFTGEWSAGSLKSAMLAAITEQNYKNIEVLWPVRTALSLRPASPDVFDLLHVLGQSESRRRLDAFQ